ncbi:MAG: hypothetical protein F6K09_02885 [Merismopedia sp. SIO2A8]|nr:hypothetical protein [Merismopedia sp. SIO2A8]
MFDNQTININALIKCWLFFMGSLAIARYPLPVCIFLGLIGGLAGGLLSRWWQLSSTPDPTDNEKNTAMPKAVELFRKQLKALGLEQQANSRQQHRPKPRIGFLGRTRVPYSSRSRRYNRSSSNDSDS